MKKKRFSFSFYLFLLLFVAFLMLTLFFLFVDADRRVERVLYFPDETGLQLHGEIRKLPVRADEVGNIELFVKEQLLGPVSMDLYRLFPAKVKLESILMKKNVLYLSFSESLVSSAEPVAMSLTDIMDGIKKAIIFNFPNVKEVKITIGGEPVA